MMCALRDLAAQDAARVRFVCAPDEESEDVDRRSTDVLVARRPRAPTSRSRASRPTCTSACRPRACSVARRGARARRPRLDAVARRQRGPQGVDVFRRIETLPFARESSELFDRPSINLGRIEGGDAVNKVPDQCTMDVDIRYLPGQEPGEILEQIRAIPDVEVVRRFCARPRWSRAPTRTCARCATRSGGSTGARRSASGATAPRTRSRSSRPASRRSSSARSAPATTAPRSGSRSPRWRATGGRSATSCAACRRALGARRPRAVDGGLA